MGSHDTDRGAMGGNGHEGNGQSPSPTGRGVRGEGRVRVDSPLPLGEGPPISGVRVASTEAVLLSDAQWRAVQRSLGLSPQQIEIARLIAEEDLQVKQIALRLKISQRSVTTQLERMFAKLSQEPSPAAGGRGQGEGEGQAEGVMQVRSRAALVARLWREERRLRVEP